jgi:hypothetical protein
MIIHSNNSATTINGPMIGNDLWLSNKIKRIKESTRCGIVSSKQYYYHVLTTSATYVQCKCTSYARRRQVCVALPSYHPVQRTLSMPMMMNRHCRVSQYLQSITVQYSHVNTPSSTCTFCTDLWPFDASTSLVVFVSLPVPFLFRPLRRNTGDILCSCMFNTHTL